MSSEATQAAAALHFLRARQRDQEHRAAEAAHGVTLAGAAAATAKPGSVQRITETAVGVMFARERAAAEANIKELRPLIERLEYIEGGDDD